jgi:hypothetical protein
MDGSHQTLNDSKVIVDDLGQWRKAVGSAGCVGNLLKNISWLEIDHKKYVDIESVVKKTYDFVTGVIGRTWEHQQTAQR